MIETTLMNKSYYSPIRRCADGSIYLDKNHLLTEFFGGAAAILLLTSFFTAIVMFALIDPFGVEAERHEKVVRTDGVGGPGNDPAKTRAVAETDATNISVVNLPSILPVEGRMTSSFGYRVNPFGGTSSEFHAGQDIAAPIGTPVVASADGEIVFAGWQRDYGNIVIINHADGVSTRYAHLSRCVVRVRELVVRGTPIGTVGSTGRSTGAHLHYEVRVNNQSVDPLGYLPKSENSK